MKIIHLRVVLTVLLLNGVNGYADPELDWPQPTAPYEETDPFIEPAQTDVDDEANPPVENPSLGQDELQDVPLKEQPLDDNPLLQTPLEQQQEDEGIQPQAPEGDEPLPDHPLEQEATPLSKRMTESQNR